MAKQEDTKPKPPRIRNKKASYNFFLLERFEAGIALVGSEVKSLRAGRASLEEAFARVDDGQLVLVGCRIDPYEQASHFNHDPVRKRTLLMHRRQIKRIDDKLKQRGQTLVPLAIYFNPRGLAKVELALAKGKTKGDRRQDLRRKQDARDIARASRR